ncbi:helix-turn-helix domain-containing protein [Bacillus sp. J33]|uniref:helix-turn-helix domain-containing protein n=1 Tax=Bacillus sp. J33 TaxID=935836 RepID=UPI00047CF676|nr:helix-turn-helix domain-containing protein [Bacillus sp. J33]
MKYEEIPEHLILNYEALKIVLFEEIKALFINRPHVLSKWSKFAYQMTKEEILTQKPTEEMRSFGVLISLFTEAFFHQKPITKEMVKEVVSTSGDTIKAFLAGHLYQEFPNVEVKYSVNDTKIEEVLEKDYIVSSTNMDFHLMRDMVTKKNGFKEGETGYLATEIIDNRGNVKGVAELRPHEMQTELTIEQQMWLESLGETLNSLDDLTADLFDLISYLWLTQPKSSDGYIEFHSNDALRLRNIKKRSFAGKEFDYREEDRFNIMRRVAALSSIWVSLGDQTIKIVNTAGLQDSELYKFKDFQKMFEIGKIRVAYDKDTGEAKGIYAVQVRPTSILTPYLEGPKKTLGILDLKVFKYNHSTQRAHKRLTRYLNLQWRIRTARNTLGQPFKVSTLLKEMDFSSRYNGVALRDKFENTLDDLQADGIIKKWLYIDEINEEMVGKRNWVKEYWGKLNVHIMPADYIVKENKKILSSQSDLSHKRIGAPLNQTAAAKEVIRTSAGMAHDQEENLTKFQPENSSKQPITLTPEKMKEALDYLNISIRQAAEEIGVAHTTLSRYIKRENKRQNKKNDEKMLNWLKEKFL